MEEGEGEGRSDWMVVEKNINVRNVQSGLIGLVVFGFMLIPIRVLDVSISFLSAKSIFNVNYYYHFSIPVPLSKLRTRVQR